MKRHILKRRSKLDITLDILTFVCDSNEEGIDRQQINKKTNMKPDNITFATDALEQGNLIAKNNHKYTATQDGKEVAEIWKAIKDVLRASFMF